MPIRSIAGADAQYYLLSFDENGTERPEANGILLSDVVRNKIADPNEAITDVFFTSHGWKGDVAAAIEQYDRWVGEMARCSRPRRRARRAPRDSRRSGRPALAEPALRRREAAGGSGAACSAPATSRTSTRRSRSMRRASPTRRQARARRSARSSSPSVEDDGANETLPADVREAYQTLFAEAGLDGGDGDPGAPPGADHEQFDPDAIIEGARLRAAARRRRRTSRRLLGGGFFDKLKGLVRLAAAAALVLEDEGPGARVRRERRRTRCWRACRGAAPPKARFHLMGHSFGCIVVSATVAGPAGRPTLPRPVDSLFLVQGALSLWSYAADIPIARGHRAATSTASSRTGSCAARS